MTTILDIVNRGDVCSILCFVAILAVVGSKMVEQHPLLRVSGWRLAIAAFLIYCAHAGFTFRPTNAQGWLWVVFRGLLAGALTLPLSWIGMSVLAFTKRLLIDAPAKRVRDFVRSLHEREREIQVREQQLKIETLRFEREDRERSRNKDLEVSSTKAKQRRDDARLRCVMLYDQHSTALSARLPRERLQEYFDEYMADSLEPDIVEGRAGTLIALIEECVKQDKPRQKNDFESLAELAAFFQRHRAEADQLPYDDEVRDSLHANINIQEEQAIRRFLSA